LEQTCNEVTNIYASDSTLALKVNINNSTQAITNSWF